MRCLWLDRGRLSYRTDVESPTVVAGEALLQLRLAGICATDLELVRGYYPFAGIPGHEFVADVLEAPTAREWEGKRVVGEINAACGSCPTCAAGRPTHCPERTVLGIVGRNGAFAEWLVLPAANLHFVPDAVPDEVAVFCEPLAAALQILEQVHLRPGHRVLVVGAGRLGQLVARVLAAQGCALAVVERHEQLRGLLEAEGIWALEPEELADVEAFDIVVEASGAPAGFAVARQALRPRGTLVLKSTYAGKLELDASALVVDEITVIGSRCGPFAPALRMLEKGQIDPRPFIEARYDLADGLLAFEHAARPGALKVLLHNPGGVRDSR